MQRKYGLSNIRVNAIAPGYIQTDMNNQFSKEDEEELIKNFSIKRIGKAEDVANCAYMLVQNDYITGQVMVVDGGWMN